MSQLIRFVLPGIILFGGDSYDVHKRQDQQKSDLNVPFFAAFNKYVTYRSSNPITKQEFRELACVYNYWSNCDAYKFTERIQHGLEDLFDHISLHKLNEMLHSKEDEHDFLCEILEGRLDDERVYLEKPSIMMDPSGYVSISSTTVDDANIETKVKQDGTNIAISNSVTTGASEVRPSVLLNPDLEYDIEAIFTYNNMFVAAGIISATNMPLAFDKERRTFAAEMIYFWFNKTIQDAIKFSQREIEVCKQVLARSTRHERMVLKDSDHVRLKSYCQLAYDK